MTKMNASTLYLNETRFREDYERLTLDGATSSGGLNRPALSEAHLAARETFREMIRQRGFQIREDGAGNLSACHVPSGSPKPIFLLGSHLDSVANGGRFDGTLGVAAAFEVIQVLREHDPTIPVEAIDFTDEEGTWVSLLGSRAVSGQLTQKDLDYPRGDPETFQRALEGAGLTREGILSATRTSTNLHAYLELHIEQGTRLEKSNTEIGIVTGMVGIHMYLVTFNGQANHAGTTPMNERRDAALGASKFCLLVQETITQQFPDCVSNVGRMDFSPGAFNIVPDQVTAFMEFRTEDSDRANLLRHTLQEVAEHTAKEYGLIVDFRHLESVVERKMDSSVIEALETQACALGVTSQRLPSLAGHDAQSMAHLCPSGLIFIPSSGGYSHSSLEYTPWSDCINGAKVLLNTTQQLAATLKGIHS